ncbi:unnamed protein product [Adineta steineri]|uniref:Uncharacterized protein n=1 Tax=Adineta steineri TaxID=433720 RepID=A0A815YWT5_9BILA|nr:unnamed protein product [Adineta steineri]CAF1670805.1 unnamed protein product [Adineta steineri]
MNVVQTYLQQLDNRKQQYETEIVEITKSITNYHRVIQPIIEKFILQQLYSLHVKTIYRTKFIYNEYEYQRLQSILNETKLNNDQIQEISHLCHSIYAYQESKQEFTLLVHYMRQSKDLLRVSDTIKDIKLPAHFKIMQNQDIRQQFIELHRTNLDHYQNRMKKSLLNLAKIRMNEKQKLFDDAQTNSQQKQHNLPLCQQFNWIVRDTIQLILSNITESLRTMYQLKTFELLGKISLN